MVGHSGVDMNNWVLMWSVVVGLIGITGCALCTLTFKVPGTGLAGGSLGHRMGGLFYLSRRALSQRTQLSNTASYEKGSTCAPPWYVSERVLLS